MYETQATSDIHYCVTGGYWAVLMQAVILYSYP